MGLTSACLTVSLIQGQELSALDAVAESWDVLWHRHGQRTAFGLAGWARAWWKTFGPGHDLSCAFVADSEGPVAIVPLVRTQDGVLHLMGIPQADYGDMLGDPARAAAALEVTLNVLAKDRDWDRIELKHVREDAVLATALAGLSPHWSRRIATTSGESCPAAVAGADPAKMYQAFLGKSSLKRYTRKLAALGDLSFVHYADPREARQKLALLTRQHEERSAVAGRRSQFLDDPREEQLYLSLIDELDPASTVRFGILWAGDRPVAGHFGFEIAGRFIFYKPAFDVDCWEMRPGQVLLAKLFEYCMARRVRIFDFAIGDEAYKFRFANESPRTYNHTISGHRMGALRRRLAGRAKEAIGRRPRLRRAVLRLRDGRGADQNSGTAWLAAFESPPDHPALELPSAQLSDLARLAITDPELFPESAIEGLRERMKAGQKCVVVRSAGVIQALGWVLSSGGEAALNGWSGNVLYGIWLREKRDARDCVEQLTRGASPGRPLLVLVPRKSALADTLAALGWSAAGTIPAVALLNRNGPEA